MFLYAIIFLSKVIENAVSTLRIIVVANGKKLLGAVLQGIVAIIWICVTGIVVVDVLKDFGKIIAFALGSIVGSYLGSKLEEKIALGNKLLIVIVNNDLGDKIYKKLYNNIVIKFSDVKFNNQIKNVMLIFIPRKKVINITRIIRKIDEDALIISENAFMTVNKKTNEN